MPFISKDWRSPGEAWVKTDDGWERLKVLECGKRKRYHFYKSREKTIYNFMYLKHLPILMWKCSVAVSHNRLPHELTNTNSIGKWTNEKWIAPAHERVWDKCNLVDAISLFSLLLLLLLLLPCYCESVDNTRTHIRAQHYGIPLVLACMCEATLERWTFAQIRMDNDRGGVRRGFIIVVCANVRVQRLHAHKTTAQYCYWFNRSHSKYQLCFVYIDIWHWRTLNIAHVCVVNMAKTFLRVFHFPDLYGPD